MCVDGGRGFGGFPAARLRVGRCRWLGLIFEIEVGAVVLIGGRFVCEVAAQYILMMMVRLSCWAEAIATMVMG